MISVCLFLGAPGIMSASPYAGAGFPPTFAIPQAAGIHAHPDPGACMPTQPQRGPECQVRAPFWGEGKGPLAASTGS